MTAAAGEPWDALVAARVARDLAGLECLSGIPGLVGATPIQNVGAYGQEVAETIARVRVVERATRRVHELDAATRAASATATARFKRDARALRGPRRDVRACARAARRPCATRELARRPPAGRAARRWPRCARRCSRCGARKSMVLEPTDANRRSVGSFFMNPIVDGRGRRARGAARCRRRRRHAAAQCRASRPGRREALGRLADRARRLREGPPPRCGGDLAAARAGAGPPRRRAPPSHF